MAKHESKQQAVPLRNTLLRDGTIKSGAAHGVPKSTDKQSSQAAAIAARRAELGTVPNVKMVTPYITQQQFDKTFPK